MLWVSGRDSYGTYMVSACGASSSASHLSAVAGRSTSRARCNGITSAATGSSLISSSPGAAEAACSYPVSDSGALGPPTTYPELQGRQCLRHGSRRDPAGDRLNFVVGGDYESCGAVKNSVGRWAYPSGGKPTSHGTLSSSYAMPDGTAVSTK